MPYNNTLPDYYVDENCQLIGKASDGSYDLGSAQQLTASECASALANWQDFVKNQGSKFGIQQEGSGSQGESKKNGGGIFGGNGGKTFLFGSGGGLFSWIGLGLIGKGKDSDGPPGMSLFDWLIIAVIVVVIILFLRRK